MPRSTDHQNRRFFCWTLSLRLVFVAAFLPNQTLFGQQPLEIKFNLVSLPSSRQAMMALSSQGFATFEKRPLGECLKTLGTAYRTAIWIDRRVDTSRLISIVGATNDSQDSQTTLGRLVAVARLGGADAGLVENVVYVGPSDQVGIVQRAAVRLHNEIMTHRASKSEKVELQKLSWEDITTHSELLDIIEKQWSVKVNSQLPHDIMHAGELPASTLATQLTLLHAGFGLQVDCDSDGTFSSTPLAQESIWKADYGDKELQTDRLVAARKEYPKATMQTKGKVSTVTGPTGFHMRLLAPRVSNINPRTTDPKFTIPQFRAPLERVIGDLAKHLGMQVKWSEEIPQSKRQAVVTFGVKEWKTADEIVKQIADESGLTIQRKQQTIEVSP